MKYILLYLVLFGFCAFVAGSGELDADRHDILWMNLFSKINGILNETTRLNERQNDLEETMKTHLRRMEERENALEQSVKSHLTNMEARETALKETVTAYFTKLVERENTLEQKMNTHFTNLEKKQQETENALKHNFNHKWTTILRRKDGSIDFSGGWEEYKSGFGHPDGEFFIGLERLHALTTKGAPQELMVILKDFEGEMRLARYDLFGIGNETEKYVLKQLGAYSGNAGNGLVSLKGVTFSTYDNENDAYQVGNCAEYFKGGWWFEKCYQSLLTGPYSFNNGKLDKGIMWLGWKGKLKYAEMKIRPTVF